MEDNRSTHAASASEHGGTEADTKHTHTVTPAADPVSSVLGMSDIFTYKSLVHALAGATGGVTAISVFFPLNTARIRIQVASDEEAQSLWSTIQNTIDQEGIQALYQGWKSAVVAIGSSNFVYFYTYHLLKVAFRQQTGRKELSAATNLMVASAAGVVNVLLTSPFWTVNTRLVVQRKKAMRGQGSELRYKVIRSSCLGGGKGTKWKEDDGMSALHPSGLWFSISGIIDAFSQIFRDEGYRGLWAGVIPSLWLVSNPSVQFVVYERIRLFMERVAEKRGRRITPLEFFFMGALAKAAATIATYPLQLAQSKLRVDKEKKYKGTIDVLLKIQQKVGIKGLFQGIQAKLWQTVLTAAFQFLTYEEVKYLVFLLLLGPKKVPKASE